MNIVFDFAGVLFHWAPLALVRRELPQRVHDEASALHWFEQVFQGFGGDWAGFDRGTIEAAPLAGRIAARTGLPLADVTRLMAAIPRSFEAHPPTVALIKRLRVAGHRLFYLSNMPEPYAQHLEREHPLGEWFDDGVISARVQAIKPEPAIFAAAAQRFGVPAQELVFIDDHAPNVSGAEACGWQAIHFRSAAQVGEALAALGAVH